jgi:hypothetical protein
MKSIPDVVLWKYADDVSADRLYAHHHLAFRTICTWIGLSVLMCSSMAEFMLSRDGRHGTLPLIILLASGSGAMLLSVPGIICCAWCEEIEHTLRARGLPIPGGRPVGERVASGAMKMCFWFAVIVLIASWAQRY